MNDWFREVGPNRPEASSPERLLECLGTAAFFGVVVAVIYYLTQRRGRLETASLVSTLVLLTILLAMVTLVIGQNLARAFGLVGVLSIVRFRTIVDDTRDTAFVIFAVITGMAIGSSFITLAWASALVIGVTAWGLSVWSRGGGRGTASTLVIKLNVCPDPESVVTPALLKHLAMYRVTEVGTAKQGVALELTYSARLRPEVSPVALILELKRIEGVQGVEWKDPSAN
ncbi:DUF4956 domain-containing protein [Gemmata sp.]|uniref:DUF4956 domain-containing protein n=1 Tax=Gemmata sp. TaxID=1914242 RepID=UPI003F70E927